MTTKLLGQSKVIVKDGAFQVVHDYKCNDQRTMIKSPQVYKECNRYFIHGKSIFQGVVVLSKSQALKIHRELGKLLKKPDHKKEMEEDKNKFI